MTAGKTGCFARRLTQPCVLDNAGPQGRRDQADNQPSRATLSSSLPELSLDGNDKDFDMAINLAKTPKHHFSKQLAMVGKLLAIERDLTAASVPQLSMKIQLINQAYVVHLMAVWQAFVEDLASHATPMARPALTDPNAARHLTQQLKRFNTPNCVNIDTLFERLVGLSAMSETTAHLGTTVAAVNAILQIRHRIAHTAWAKSALDAKAIIGWIDPLYKTGIALEGIVVSHAKRVSGTLTPIA